MTFFGNSGGGPVFISGSATIVASTISVSCCIASCSNATAASNSSKDALPCRRAIIFSFIFVASLAFSKQTYIYLDFTERQIVTVEHYAWFETSKRCRPLTDFSNIVVRHLCHPGGEGPDTYTGSVGLKPVDGELCYG